jgi:hypothetical protein
MAIKINGATTITDSRRGVFNQVNPGAYTTANRPTGASEGDVIYDSDEKNIFIWNGTEWAGTSTGGASFSQQLDEKVNIRSEAITTDSFIATLAGNVHYYTAASSGTFTPDITYTLFDTFNSNLDIGSTAAITILTNSNVNGYLTGLNIDGVSQTVLWSGGEAPTEGGQSGVDAYSFQIIKTADSTYTVLGSYNSFA